MTPELVLSRVRDLLRSLVWTGSSNKVFGASAVYVTGESPIQNISQYPSPSAFVIDQGFSNHPQHPGIGTQHFTVQVFIQNVASNYGEGGILGRNELSSTKSAGRGIKDIHEIVLKELYNQTALSSAKIVIVIKNATKPQFVATNTPLYFFTVGCESFASVY